MQQAISGTFKDIPLELVENPEGMKPGWYYTLPIPEDLKAHKNEVAYDGPYDTQLLAANAAVDFVKNALTDWANDQGLVAVEGFGVFYNPDPNFVPRDADDDMA